MDLFHEGNIHFIDEDYDLAIKSYTAVIEKNTELYQAYLHRGTAHLKCKRYPEAIEDFNKCLEVNADCELAYYRLGVAYFESEEYRSAKSSFEVGSKIRQQEGKRDVTAYTRYIRKCEAELSDLKAAESTKPGANTSNQPSTSASSSKPAAVPAPAPAPSNQPTTSIPLPIKYQYYQSMQSLTVSIMAKNLTENDIIVSIEPTHLRFAVKYKLTHGAKVVDQVEEVINKDLYAQIDAEKSKFTLFKTKVEIILVKIEQHHWPSIEANGAPKLPPASSIPAPPPPVAAARPVEQPAEENPKTKVPKAYASNRDWDRLGQEISKELDAEKPEGEEAMAALFRQIFRDADPETRMAMKKSFQTSGGTVLSTNWNEVSKTDYEKVRQAPKGVEWKNWEGEKVVQKPFDHDEDDK